MAGARRRLSRRALELLEAPDSELFVSAVTYWELAIKAGTGKLGGFFNDLMTFVAHSRSEFRLTELDVTPAHAIHVINLPLFHSDPFDRLLVAQALVEGLQLVSSDSQLARYGVQVLW
jgi:PIN domain nuclease of toxin-antitoxin system